MPLPTIPSGNVFSSLPTGFNVDNSCRFNDGDSPKMTKSLGTATNNKKWTVNCWLKLSNGIIGNNKVAWSARNGTSGPYVNFNLQGSDNDHQLVIYGPDTDGLNDFSYRTSRKFRDQSAWYMITVAMDTTLGTAGDRLRIYVNGVEETDFAEETHPTQNKVYPANYTGYTFVVGARTDDSEFWDGYIAEFCMIDGQQLTPLSFGEFDEDSPTIFKPKDVSELTFGNNGFYLDFEDSSNLGNDANGGTDLTESNLTAADQVQDSPTNNWCVINPLDYYPTRPADTEGNTVYNKSSTGDTHNSFANCTIGVTKGKWYYELKVGDSNGFMVGWVKTPHGLQDSAGAYASDSGLYTVKNNGAKIVAGSETGSAWNTVTTNDIIGLAYDFDNLKFYISKNGTWENSGDPTSGSTGTGSFGNIASGATYVPMIGNTNYGATSLHYFNFGNPAFTISSGNSDGNGYGNFEYSVPSGYYSLCTKNLAEYG